MCSRFWLGSTPETNIIYREAESSPLLARSGSLSPFGEMRPADIVPVIAPDRRGIRAVFPMKWGFSGRKLLINARAETAAVRSTFRDAWANHRCAVPASWYYEWSHTEEGGKKRVGSRYRIRTNDGGLAWLCGLYRIEAGFPVFVILTRDSCEAVSAVHDRMPLILPGDRVDGWIRPGATPDDFVRFAVTDLVPEKMPESQPPAPLFTNGGGSLSD